MSVVLLAILLAVISCSFSSAIYDPSKEVKKMTEEDWPSHGPWIVSIEYGANELFIEKAKTRHLALQREAKIRNEEEIVHSFAVKKSFSDLTGVNAVVLEGLSKNDLKSMSEVVGVYPDLPVYPTAYSWGTDRIDQSALPLSSTYNSYFKGCGVDIYVVDTGLDTTHIEFAPVNGVSRTVSNIYNEFGAITSDTDGQGHGTHCAGSAGGNTVGTAPCANIYGLKIFDDNGGGGLTSYIISALNLVKQRHVSNPNAKSVVSMSLGGSCGTSCAGNPLLDVISTMYDLGILFAVAAGNENNANACLTFPAASPKAITVAASDQFDSFASYSNTGPCVDIIAPGSDIISACATCAGTSSYSQLSGTSMATPHVAGALALLLQKNQVSFTTAPDIVTKALLCDAARNKIQNIVPRSFGTCVNLLLQVPKNDNNFGNCGPSAAPTFRPSFRTTAKPTSATLSFAPTAKTTVKPTTKPVTSGPSRAPTRVPTAKPSVRPSIIPSKKSSFVPSAKPVAPVPSRAPTRVPTATPSVIPSIIPSTRPSILPSAKPVVALPSRIPTRAPTAKPTTKSPTIKSSVSPTAKPSAVSSKAPAAATTTIGDGCISAGSQYSTQPGYYCVGLQAFSCPAGYFCPGGQGGYGYSCPPQTTSSAKMSVCVPLTPDYGGGCTGCSAVYSGAYCSNSACYACPTGAYCPGNDRGYLCPAGTSNIGNTQQAACVPNAPPVNGDGCGNGQSQCSSAGNYCVLSQGVCYTCPAGSYCPNAFGSYAYTCPTGKTSLAGAASCH